MHSTRLSTHALDVSIGKIRICDALNLSVASGEHWAILGRNGVGKSTLLMTLAGLRRPQHGELNLCGVQTGVSPSAPALRASSGAQLGFWSKEYS